MRIFILKSWILLILFFVSALQTRAQFIYTTNAGTLFLSSYTGSGGAVVIPSSAYGMSVVGIANNAFQNKSKITSVTIPSSVTSIGDWAFESCAGLTNISIPSSVTSIGNGAFAGCNNLTNIVIPSGVASIGYNAFQGCGRLTSVTIPSSVTSIGDDAFVNCGLTSITIPSSVTNIGSWAFESCGRLTSITISSGVTSIGSWAFAYCSGLTNITIPGSVTNIGSWAFAFCTFLNSALFQGNAPTPSDDGTVFNGTALETVYYLSGTTGWDATFDGIPTAIYSIAPPPTLGITIYGSNSFPAVFFLIETGTNFVLQTTTNLSSGPWMAVTNGIPFSEVSNGIPVSGLIITNVQPAAFFRLH